MREFCIILCSVIVAIFLIINPFSSSYAIDYYAVASGNWNVSATWSTVCGGAGGAGTPGATDNAYICSGITVNINVASQCNNLTFQGGGINYPSNNTLAVNNNMTVNNVNTVTGNNASRILNVSGNLIISSGASLDINGQTVNISGNVQIDGTLSFSSTTGTKTFSSDLTLDSSGAISFSATETITLNGNLITNPGSSISGSTTGIINTGGNLQVLSGGTSTFGRVTISIVGSATIDGAIDLNNNTGIKTFAGPVILNSGSSWTSTTITTDTKLIFQNGITHNGSSFQAGACTFNTNNQNLAGSSTISFSNDVTISGSIAVNNQNTSNITIYGTLNGSAAGSIWNNNSNSTLNYGNACNPAYGYRNVHCNCQSQYSLL